MNVDEKELEKIIAWATLQMEKEVQLKEKIEKIHTSVLSSLIVGTIMSVVGFLLYALEAYLTRKIP